MMLYGFSYPTMDGGIRVRVGRDRPVTFAPRVVVNKSTSLSDSLERHDAIRC
jgi:hypothetical protein